MKSREEDPSRSRPSSLDNAKQPDQSRRAILKRGALILAGTAVARSSWGGTCVAAHEKVKHQLRIGLLTDCHFADKEPVASRHYRDSLFKIKEAVSKFTRSGATFAVELGDFIDAAKDAETEIGYLKTVEREFAKFEKDRHYVLGNHCVYTLTKKEFIDNCAAKRPHYSFDEKGFHFIVLDACYRHDGVEYGRQNFDWTDANIPADQMNWLAADLAATGKKTIVFVHQNLDRADSYGIKNARDVRKILEKSGKVLVVFQGHSHKNAYRDIGGIHYCTLRAVVEKSGLENNGYSLVDFYDDGSIRIEGFRKQEDYGRLARNESVVALCEKP